MKAPEVTNRGQPRRRYYRNLTPFPNLTWNTSTGLLWDLQGLLYCNGLARFRAANRHGAAHHEFDDVGFVFVMTFPKNLYNVSSFCIWIKIQNRLNACRQPRFGEASSSPGVLAHFSADDRRDTMLSNEAPQWGFKGIVVASTHLQRCLLYCVMIWDDWNEFMSSRTRRLRWKWWVAIFVHRPLSIHSFSPHLYIAVCFSSSMNDQLLSTILQLLCFERLHLGDILLSAAAVKGSTSNDGTVRFAVMNVCCLYCRLYHF